MGRNKKLKQRTDRGFRVVLKDLPKTIRGCTMLDNGRYIVLINKSISKRQQVKALKHELEHIRHGDFSCDMDVNQLETIRHKSEA